MTMVIAPPQKNLITGEQFFAIGDIRPCELLKGEIVFLSVASGEHGLIAAEVVRLLRNFIDHSKSGWVLGGGVGIYTGRHPDTVRSMDVAFLSKVRHPARPKGYLDVAPELVVEIISPADRWKDIQDKLKEYFAIGVDTVWLIDPEDQTIFIYSELTEMIRLGKDDILRGEGPLTGFEVPVGTIFTE